MSDIYLRFRDMDSVTEFFGKLDIRGRRLTDQPDAATWDDVDRVDVPLRGIDGAASFVLLGPHSVVTTKAIYNEDGVQTWAAVTDDAIWVVLRLLGAAAEDNGGEWLGSKITADIKGKGGSTGTKRGARMARKTTGSRWVEVYNLEDLVALGIVPHVIAGGPLFSAL